MFSAAFRDEIVGMLATGGISVDFAYSPSRNLAWRYKWGTPPTGEYLPDDDESHYLEAGSGGLKLSAVEYARLRFDDRGASPSSAPATSARSTRRTEGPAAEPHGR